MASSATMRSSTPSILSSALPSRSTLAFARTVPAPRTKPSSLKAIASSIGREPAHSAQSLRAASNEAMVVPDQMSATLIHVKRTIVKNEERTRSGGAAAPDAGVGAAVFVEEFGQALEHDAAQLLRIDDRHGAAVVARHVMADADRRQLDFAQALDVVDDLAQVLFEVIAGVDR